MIEDELDGRSLDQVVWDFADWFLIRKLIFGVNMKKEMVNANKTYKFLIRHIAKTELEKLFGHSDYL